MKKTDLAKQEALKIMGQVKPPGKGHSSKVGAVTPGLDRKTQRKLDQAAGLVPFAAKLPLDLVAQLNQRAQEGQVSLNDLLAQLLTAALDKPAA